MQWHWVNVNHCMQISGMMNINELFYRVAESSPDGGGVAEYYVIVYVTGCRDVIIQ